MAFTMDFRTLARCSAKARSNNGMPCRQAAMRNGRCYWHGGPSRVKHGRYTVTTKALKLQQRRMLHEARETLNYLSELAHENKP